MVRLAGFVLGSGTSYLSMDIYMAMLSTSLFFLVVVGLSLGGCGAAVTRVICLPTYLL